MAKPTLVEIELDLFKCYRCFIALKNMFAGPVPGRLSIKKRRIMRDLKPHALDFEEERLEVLKEYGVETKKGEFKLTPDGDFEWKDPEGYDRLKEIADQTASFKINPLLFSDMDSDSININEEADLDVLEDCGILVESIPEKEEDSDG